MGFKEDVSDYKGFPDGELSMHTVPEDVWSSMESFIRRSASDAGKLRSVINTIAEITGGPITNNWSWGFIEYDISPCVEGIRKKTEKERVYHFDAFMDCLAVLAEVGDLKPSEINEFLEDKGIGYTCERDFYGWHIKWYPVETMTSVVEDISETQEEIACLSKQAYERFESAKRQFEKSTNDERARKDAVRSCVDAMEALIKELGKNDDIKIATKNLKDEVDLNGHPLWGPMQIIKDGNNLFDLLHKLYPDVRHGTQDIDTANMSTEEAEYFVGRITVFMKYISSRAKKLGYEI